MESTEQEPNLTDKHTSGPESRSNAQFALILLSITLVASVILPLPGHDGKIIHLPTICVFYHTTGLPCPACGLTRAFVCIGHGRLLESVHWHPLGLIVYVGCVLVWAQCAMHVWKKRDLVSLPLIFRRYLFSGALALFFIVGFARMAWFAVHHIAF
jgi:hypothetical protein